MNATRLCVLLLGATLAGCQTIHVEDPSGNPINGATVWTVSEGGSPGFKQVTVMGMATLSISMEPPGSREYLYISKEGYLPNPLQTIRPTEFNHTVVLREANPFRADGNLAPIATPKAEKSSWDWDTEIDWDPLGLWEDTDPKQPTDPRQPTMPNPSLEADTPPIPTMPTPTN
ncbi:MAG: hypothetical protein HN909_02135 [Phycisphaerales bacterium]|nr:hypothetical protein [Phycisphaerales bacterium]MBT7170549.1 hypothetical protein [Phycisphaerales bacterium]